MLFKTKASLVKQVQPLKTQLEAETARAQRAEETLAQYIAREQELAHRQAFQWNNLFGYDGTPCPKRKSNISK